MSSSIRLGNDTLPVENTVDNSADYNSSVVDNRLDELVVAPVAPNLDFPVTDAQSQLTSPAREVDVNLQKAEETEDSSTMASTELPKLDHTHNNGQQDDIVGINSDASPTEGVQDSTDLVITAASGIINVSCSKRETDSAMNVGLGQASSPQVPNLLTHHKSVSVDSPKYVKDSFGNRVVVDTAAPFDSVKEAVSKFGGIVDWKAHKIQTVERRKFIEQELDKAQQEVPIYKKMSQTAEEAKVKVLNELNTAKRLIEDMKLNVERSKTEEHQAKQDSELAKLRVEEIEQGIADDSSVVAKAQLEVAKARHSAAISDLQCAKEELETLKKEYTALIAERDMTVKKAEEAKAAAMEVEKTVQDLTIELISTKEALESAHAKHLEAEEGRLKAALAKEQNSRNWEKELKEIEDEVAALSEQVLSAKELQSKLDDASTSLHGLRAELSNYKESKLNQSIEAEKSLRRTHTGIQTAVLSAQKELEDVRMNIEKAIDEVNLLKLAASSLDSELHNENATVSGLKQNHVKKMEAVQSLETEINQIELELAEAKVRETEAREKMMNLPMQLPQAAEESDRVKSQTQIAQEELNKVKEEAERAKAGVITMVRRLLAAEKDKEAARASENLALAAIKALQESENARSSTDITSPTGVVISLEEYYELSKRAIEAEEQANLRVATAVIEMEKIKETQFKSMAKLEELDEEITQRKEALKVATEKSEKAAEGKLSIEQELQKWRVSTEQRRKEVETLFIPIVTESNVESSDYIRLRTSTSPPRMSTTSATETDVSSPDVGKAMKKKKRSFFPRVLMFLAKRKTNSSK